MRAIIISNGRTRYTEEASMPTLTALRNVLVKVCYAGICRTDVGIANGTVAHQDSIVLGHEFCGVIEAFHHGGTSCDGWHTGMAVSCNPMLFGETEAEDVMCGKEAKGPLTLLALHVKRYFEKMSEETFPHSLFSS